MAYDPNNLSALAFIGLSNNNLALVVSRYIDPYGSNTFNHIWFPLPSSAPRNFEC